jgi:hypothetical protein
MCFLLLLFILGIVQAFRLDKNKGIFLVMLAVLPFVISTFLSYHIPMVPKYMIFLAIIYFIGIALFYKMLACVTNSKRIVYGFIAFLIVINAPMLLNYYSGYTKEDWRGYSLLILQQYRGTTLPCI